MAAFYIGLRVGYWLRGYAILKVLARSLDAAAVKHRQMVDNLNSTDTETMMSGIRAAADKLNLLLLKHEIIDNQHFYYTADTAQFIAQGATLEQAAANYSKNNQQIGCVAVPGQDSYFIVDGRITHQLPAIKAE